MTGSHTIDIDDQGIATLTIAGRKALNIIGTPEITALTAALLFFTPAYFMMSMMQSAYLRSDWLAIGLGMAIGPLVYLVAPDLDLLVAGLVGGTIAYLYGRRQQR